MKKTLWTFIIIVLPALPGIAQNEADSLKLTLPQAEEIFLRNNLTLLSQKYNIDENAAYIKQARIWDLPSISYQEGFFNPKTKRILQMGSYGEISFQIQQLIDIAGKHRKNAKLSMITAQNTYFEYNDLVRTLGYQLVVDFFNLYFQQKEMQIYYVGISSLQKIVYTYEQSYHAGNVAFKDVMRLKALLLNMESEKLDLLNSIDDIRHELGILLHLNPGAVCIPLYDESGLDSFDVGSASLAQLIDTAYACRYDLQQAQNMKKFSEFDLAYQKSLARPDLSINWGYDKMGSYVRNANFLGVGLDLPLWNRNKGNIRAAEARIKEAQTGYDQFALTIQHQLAASYSKALGIEKIYKNYDKSMEGDFTLLMNGITDSYNKKEIGLLEFSDFFESYKDSKLQLNKLKIDRITSIANLNFQTGKSFFNIR